MRNISSISTTTFLVALLCTNAYSLAASSTPTKREKLGHPPTEVWPQLVVGGKEDPAMGCIEENQRKLGKPYGDVLDAGTGIYSLRWLAGLLYRYSDPEDDLYMSSYMAITADDNFRRDVKAKADELGIGDHGSVIVGNWNDDSIELDNEEERLCNGQMFDTILADYLVGAVDYFAPFFQDKLFHRLVSHLKSGGRMYLTGLNPIPEQAEGPGDIFCRVTKLRDACILLAGSRPYREHPEDWVVRHCEQAGLEVINVSKFPKTYKYANILTQLDAARSTLQFIKDADLREAMGKRIDKLDAESKVICENCPDGKFILGYDWVIMASKA